MEICVNMCRERIQTKGNNVNTNQIHNFTQKQTFQCCIIIDAVTSPNNLEITCSFE